MNRKRLKVLCVDDDQDALEALESGLESAGHDVVSVTDGVAGLDLLLQVKFDIAIIDIGLPFMNGYQLARGAREILKEDTPPLVALTAFSTAADRQRSEAAGLAAHLSKPISLDHLLHTLESLTKEVAARPLV